MLNVKYTTIFFLLNTLLSFVSRKAFLDTIGTQYLGFISLVQNLLGYLNLTELGLGVAISYALYKPIHENDHTKINEIMTFYAYLVKIIGVIILVVGTGICFFIPVLSKNEIDPFIGISYFFAYVIATMISYFTTYKYIVIQTDQKMYVITKIQGIIKMLKVTVLIFLLYQFGSFMLWFAVGIAFDLSVIIFSNRKVSAMYPWLAINKNISLKESFKANREAFANISTTFLYKIGNVIIYQTDSLLITVFANFTMLGKIVNYTMLTMIISNFLTNIIWTAKSGIGNLVVEKSNEKTYAVWREFFTISFYIASVCSLCLYLLTDKFILLWLNNSEMLLDNIFLIALVSNMFFKITREPVEVFKTSYGLFKSDRLNTILEFTGNFIISLALGYLIGPVGVILGTSIAYILTSFWTRPKLLFSQGFHKSLSGYMLLYFIHIAVAGIGIFLSYEFASHFIFPIQIDRPILRFLVRSILVFSSSSFILLLMFIPDKYFRNFFVRMKTLYFKK